MANIFDRESAAGKLQPKQQIEDIARKTKVPVNVLLSAAELGGARDDDERLQIATAVASQFGPRVQAGESIKDLIREAAGDDKAAEAFIVRARQIAEEQYPQHAARARAAKSATQTGGLGTAFGVGVDALQQGYGSALEGLGKSIGSQGLEAYGAGVAARNKAQIEEAAPGLTGVDDIDGIGSAAKFAGETFAQQVPQLALSLGAGAAGAKAGAALGAGAGPVGAAVGAAVGGVGAGILANIPYFYGSNRERQKEAIEQGYITEMDEGSAFLSSVPQAALDTIVDRVMVGAIAGPLAKAGGGLLTRASRGAAQGVLAEVPTEIGQAMIERAQAGLPLDSEDAIKEYRDVGIAAGLIGGTLGGAGGALSREAPQAGPIAEQADVRDPQDEDPGQTQMLALPAPNRGGTIFGEGAPGVDPTIREREDWMPRSSDVAPVQQPGEFRRAAPAGGPLRAALQQGAPIPANTIPGAAEGQAAAQGQSMGVGNAPVPPADPAPMDAVEPAAQPGQLRDAAGRAPGPIRPDMPNGSSIVVTVPGLPPIKAMVNAQTPLGIQIVDQDGEISEISREEIELGAIQIAPAPSPAPAPTPLTSPVSQPQPAPRQDRLAIPDPEMTPDLARRRLQMVEDRAKQTGWDKSLRQMRDDLRAVLGVQEDQAIKDNAASADIISKRDGSPFDTEAKARQALGNRGIGMGDYRIEPKDGGFVAVRAGKAGQIAAPEQPQIQQPGEATTDGSQASPTPVASMPPDGMGGPENDAPNPDADQAAVPPSVAVAEDGRSAAGDAGIGQDAISGTPDAADPGQPDDALTGEQSTEQWNSFRFQNSAAKDFWRRVFKDSVPQAVQSDAQRVLDALSSGDVQTLKSIKQKYQAEATLAQGGGGAGPGKMKKPRRGVFTLHENAEAAIVRFQREAQNKPTSEQSTEQSTEQWLKDRGARVAASKAAGKTHLDDLQQSVEGMRGKPFFNVHDPKERGVVRTVANTGEVVVNWADDYSADKNLAGDPIKDGKSSVRQSWLMPTDLQDYVVGEQPATTDEVKAPKSAAEPKATDRDSMIRAQLGEAMARPAETHATKKGKELKGYIIPDATPGEAKAIDPYAFRKTGETKAGWFVREAAAKAHMGQAGAVSAEPAQASVAAPVAAPEPPQPKAPSGAKLREAGARAEAKIEEAAATTDPDPTPAQTEAENYRTGKVAWNGLILSIENAKGSIRRKVTPDGETAWEVEMPAHYGRILRTEGADGDHVDFYMGEMPASDFVVIVNQIDLDTGRFDEHKVILGTSTRAEALRIYEQGFSDGRGRDRIGSDTATTVAGLKSWLADGDMGKPTQPVKSSIEAIKAAAETRDWWNNGIAPPSRAGVLKDMGLFPGQEESIGSRKWDALSSAQQDSIVEATAASRAQKAKEKADRDAEKQARNAAAQEAKKKADAEQRAADLRASVGRFEELKGGTARAVVDWGESSRYVSEDGFSGHGKFMLRDGVVPEFESLVRAKKEVITEGVAAGLSRLLAQAEKAKQKIDWRFVRNVQDKKTEKWRPNSVVGQVTKVSAKGTEKTWVEIDRLAYDFARRNGFEITAGEDYGIMALRKDGDVVGMMASIRPYDSKMYNEMDQIALAAAEQAVAPQQPESEEPAPASVQEPATAAGKPTKIEDFGEKIGGARKDVWSGFKERMEEAQALDIASVPLSKSWPEPDYEKLVEAGVDPWTVSFVRAARDAIPRKPTASWKARGWVDQVKTLRDFATSLLNGRIEKEALQEKLAKTPSLEDTIGGKIDLYLSVGHAKSLKYLSFRQHTYSVLGGIRYEKGLRVWEVTKDQAATAFSNMPKTLARGDTKDEAIAAFKTIYAGLDAEGAPKGNKGKGTKFLIYRQRSDGASTYRIGVKIGANYVDLRTGIEGATEARRIIAEESDQLQSKLDRMKDIPRERKDENAPRIGADHRAGADVTPQQFAEAFGFRGVEFGNWVEDSRRQEDLNNAFDAMMDLASILDLPPRAMSLNGSLGLAFGARGSGGKNPAAAHYEPGKVVINLTKRQGRGSLAHEWFHAMDNYFAKQRAQQRGTYITDNSAPGNSPLNAGVRPELVESFMAVKRAIMATDLKKRSSNIDKMRTDPYWGTGIEMHARAFESYVIAKLEDQGASNDYLANVVNGLSWGMLAEASGLGDSYPYLKPDEIEKVRPAFDTLFRTIETRETDRGIEMYSVFEGGEDAAFAATVMSELAQVDDLFQNPVSSATTLRGVFADIDPSVRFVGRMREVDDAGSAMPGTKFLLKTGGTTPKDFFIHQNDSEVWIDVSNLSPGDAGSRIYSAVAEYALNTGRVFVGDPEGLSAVALRRRTDAMLSSALKHGTTKHLAPHPYQLEGDPRLGVPALRWTEGDDSGNIQSLIDVSIANTVALVPEVADARYDFKTGTFRDSSGKLISDELLDGWASAARGMRTARAGRNTLKRGILLSTLSRASGGDRPGLLEYALRQPGKLVAGLKRTFYSAGEVSAVPVDALRDVSAAVQSEIAGAGLAGKVSARVVKGLLGASGIPVQGRYRSGAIEVNAAAPDAIGVARHEIIHALRDADLWGTSHGLFTPEEWRELVRAARSDAALMKRVSAAYADRPASVHVEEAVAEMYREWAGAQDGKGAVSRVFSKVAAFFRTVASALRGNGFTDAAIIMDRIASGQIGGRGPDGPSGGGMSDMDMTAASTESPEFKRWFGNSKVVDANGKPMVVYHGTRAEFDAFDTNIKSHDQWFGRGSYFATNQDDLEDHLGVPMDDMRVVRAYLSIQRPYVWDISTPAAKEALFADLAAAGIKRGEGFYGEVLNGDEPARFTKWVKARGYDGVFSMAYDGKSIVEIVAFEPSQIKSVFNRGTWNPEDARMSEMRAALSQTKAKAMGMVGKDNWRNPSEWLTDAMAGFGDGDYSALSLVPGRALFKELGKNLLSARAYIKAKEAMDALRNDWHGRADTVAQKWLSLRNKNKPANDEMMDLMHRATLAGVDPSRPLEEDEKALTAARAEVGRMGPRAQQWARDQIAAAEKRAETHAILKARFDALPKEFQVVYDKVLREYSDIADDFEKAVLDNIQQSTQIGMKRAQRDFDKEMQRIKDEGLKGRARQDAIDLAQAKLDAVKKRGGFAMKARLSALRKQFESNRLKGPYFPLARFGDFFVTVRDGDGKVISFSRFESVKQQMAHVREMERAHPGRVQHGTMSSAGSLKSQVDPTFVADVERILAESGADFEVMDAVWQRWLETLPDQSIRTSKIHRKGREGWNRDAFRAFGKHMFHGAHQLARLRYGVQMQDHLDEASLEAARADDPNRAGLIVREMEKRHEFTMNPQGSAAVAGLSNLAFIWYLGATPGAALANISQTTVVGIPMMAARFKKAGAIGVTREIGRAMREFTRGKPENWSDTWSLQNTPSLSDDERDALAAAYKQGTVDKTQAHDLASVAETGIEYSATREKVMRKIAFMFHHTERFNREVTFLAAYRLGRGEGMSHADAIEEASNQVWATHFDYSNTSRPRIMQSDIGKILTTFRNFTVNMLWRLFRDAHQSFNGATAEERKEARTQLVGITLSMMAHAGIRGTWGYGLAMSLLALFMPGEDDDIEKWLQDSLLVEGDTMGAAAWNYAMGAALNGVPGQVLGLDLKERIGMPNLWFRGNDRDLEGEDLYYAHIQEFLGPVAGIPLGFYRGIEYASDGDIWRGTEAVVPKVIRDAMKAGRYSVEGVTTRNGDPLLESVNPWQVLVQASGFTPAQVAERYEINTRLKNEEMRITDARKGLHREAGDSIRSGQGIPPRLADRIRRFNAKYPEYPITPDSIRQSLESRQRASQRNEFGVSLNPKLNDRLREGQPPEIYN